MPERQRPSDPSDSLESTKRFLKGLGAIEEHMDRVLEPMHGEVQAIFERLDGNCDSIEAARRVLRLMQHLLNRLRLRLECQCQGCARPSSLLCTRTKTTQPWRFYFSHAEGKKVLHGSWDTLPPLKLVDLAGQALSNSQQSPSGQLVAPLENSEHALEALVGIEEQMDRLLEPVRVEIQQALDRLAGKRFSTLDANRRVLRRMQHLLGRLWLEFACHVPGCERPGRLRCNPQRTGAQPWAFKIEHYSPRGKACWHPIGSKDKPGRFPSLQLVRPADEDYRRPRLSNRED